MFKTTFLSQKNASVEHGQLSAGRQLTDGLNLFKHENFLFSIDGDYHT